MGTLNLQEETYHCNNIKQALESRGFRMDMEDEWEIHGPHPEVPVVYVGYAYYDRQQPPQDAPAESRPDGIWVAIYPRAVYEIEEAEGWTKISQEQRITILK